MARRLERPHLVRRFLAADHSAFASGLRHSAQRLGCYRAGAKAEEAEAFAQEVAERIACLNIAGLSDLCKRNWYGVDLNDVIAGAEKLGMTPEEVGKIIAAASWA
jgi:hypothetical protein